VADRNVGLWTAIDWTLRHAIDEHEFIYVIESDVLHYAVEKIALAEDAMDRHPEIGCVRCQEYSVAERCLYDKDVPIAASRRWAWQGHRHRFTNKRIEHWQSDVSGVYLSDFLAVLPGLNRVRSMRTAFAALANMEMFSEPDFQREMWTQHPVNALIDGGAFHARLGAQGAALTGSWSNASELASVGYRQTRLDRIERDGSYVVRRLTPNMSLPAHDNGA
jgi:hypothetical protein